MAKKNDTPQPTADNEMALIALSIPKVEDLITAEEKAAMVAKAAELTKKYGPGFEVKSKADYDGLKADLSKTVKMRTATDNWRKELKRLADDGSTIILQIFGPAEALMKGLKETYDAKESARIEAERKAREALISGREKELFALGATWQGSQFILGTTMCSRQDLELPDDKWAPVIAKFTTAKAEADIAAKANELKLLVADHKEALMMLGAVPQFEVSGVKCGPEDVGAVYGMRLGTKWATRKDLEEVEPGWSSRILAGFKSEAAAIRFAEEEAAKKAREAEIKQPEPIAETKPANPIGWMDAPAQTLADGNGAKVPTLADPPKPREVPVVPSIRASFKPYGAPIGDGRETQIYLTGSFDALRAAKKQLIIDHPELKDYSFAAVFAALCEGKEW